MRVEPHCSIGLSQTQSHHLGANLLGNGLARTARSYVDRLDAGLIFIEAGRLGHTAVDELCVAKVVLKWMKHRSEFEAEVENRYVAGVPLSSTAVVRL